MKALILTGPGKLDYRDAPVPEIDGQTLISTAHVGICGSDMHAWMGHDERRPPPLILGHEAAGTALHGPFANKPVTINPLVTCGECVACLAGRQNLCVHRQIISMPPRPGAFAEFVSVPDRNLVPVPDGVPTYKAALAEPIACAWHAVRLARRALYKPLEEASCLVTGGGAIGLGAALVLADQGALQVSIAETNASRRSVIRQCGDFCVFDPLASDHRESYDLVVDGAGFAATRRLASAVVEPGGVIMHIGLGSGSGGLDVRRVTLQEITFIGTYTYSRQDFLDTATAIFSGRLGPLDWAEIRPLSGGSAAFSDLKAGRVAAPKIILAP